MDRMGYTGGKALRMSKRHAWFACPSREGFAPGDIEYISKRESIWHVWHRLESSGSSGWNTICYFSTLSGKLSKKCLLRLRIEQGIEARRDSGRSRESDQRRVLSYLAISLAVSFKNFKRCWLIKAFMKASVLFASSRLAILSGVGNSNYASSANSAVTSLRPWKLDVGVTEVQPKQPQSVNHVHTDRLHTPPAPLVSSFPRAHKDRNKRVLPVLFL
ncbi:hypothetical protein B0H11DRAFT_2209781, partial [Mycena galericulata]